MALSYKKRGLTKEQIRQEEAAKARVGAWFLFMGLIMFALVLVQNAKADQLVHKFKSPSFNGMGTSSHYLTIENQEFSRKLTIKEEIKALQDEIEREKENSTLARFMRNRGTVMVPTTPVLGHWLKTKVFDVGYNEDNVGEYTAANGGEYPPVYCSELSCFENPFLDPNDLKSTIEALGGMEDPKVQREFLGKWTADCGMLWRHFDRRLHCVSFGDRGATAHGWVNVTQQAIRQVWAGWYPEGREPTFFLGQDFNYDPMSTSHLQVVCRHDRDARDPSNWVIYIHAEYQRSNISTEEYAEWLRAQPDLSGALIICDGSSFIDGNRGSRSSETGDADVMRRYGFDCSAPDYQNGRARNPEVRVRVNVMNRLMYTGADGRRLPRVMINMPLCEATIDAMEKELDNGTGRALKRAGSKFDKISGITDAATYGIYWIFRQIVDNEAEQAAA